VTLDLSLRSTWPSVISGKGVYHGAQDGSYDLFVSGVDPGVVSVDVNLDRIGIV
jgi:hypothetical protein